MTMKYPSKVSYGLLIFIFLIFFAPLSFELFNDGVQSKFNSGIVGLIGFLLILFALVSHLFLQTFYIIDGSQLKIKCGFISYKPIEIKHITELSATHSLAASPAPSFDRIEIKYGKFGTIIISPKDKFSFANHLLNINPNIKNNLLQYE